MGKSTRRRIAKRSERDKATKNDQPLTRSGKETRSSTLQPIDSMCDLWLSETSEMAKSTMRKFKSGSECWRNYISVVIESYESILRERKKFLVLAQDGVESYRMVEDLSTKKITNTLKREKLTGADLSPISRFFVDCAKADIAKAREEIRRREQIVKSNVDVSGRIERELELMKRILASGGSMQVNMPNSGKSDEGSHN